MKQIFKHFIKALFIASICLTIFLCLQTPSNNRNWSKDQNRLPQIDIRDNLINIKDIRNFNYRSTNDFDENYYNQEFDLKKLEKVWFMVELISDWHGPAHTLLSFEFSDGKRVCISVEIRKEQDETFSVTKGMLRQYELMYVIADENDIIKLRTNFRKHRVYLYPIKAQKEDIKKLFLGMLKRAKELQVEPEFYNTITNTCTTNIVDHLNQISKKATPLNLKVLLPGYSDQLAFDLELIDTNLNFNETKKHFRIDKKALKISTKDNFSDSIRKNF